jgi:hypothetical protein
MRFLPGDLPNWACSFASVFAMDWLFIVGVSMDLAGAIVIASAVLWQSRPETIQEASGHWGPSLWVVLLRDREQAQARFGVVLLGIGFLLQLLGHLSNFTGFELAGAIALAVGIPVGGYFAGRFVAWRKAPLTYYQYPRPPYGITDERYAYNLRSLDDVRAWRRLHAERIVGVPPQPQTTPITATIEGGRWVAGCPNCGGSWMVVTPGIDTVVCLSDCNGEYPVVFPEDREEIERLVLELPPKERSWKGETLDQLREKLDEANRRRAREPSRPE